MHLEESIQLNELRLQFDCSLTLVLSFHPGLLLDGI